MWSKKCSLNRSYAKSVVSLARRQFSMVTKVEHIFIEVYVIYTVILVWGI